MIKRLRASHILRLKISTRILLAAIAFSATGSAVNAQTVSPTHPRLWLTPSRLTRLKTFASQNTPRWARLLNYANSALTSTTPNADDIPVLALTYQVTGNTSYGTKAIQDMLAVAGPGPHTTGDPCYHYPIFFSAG